jgi:hypothetical protein
MILTSTVSLVIICVLSWLFRHHQLPVTMPQLSTLTNIPGYRELPGPAETKQAVRLAVERARQEWEEEHQAALEQVRKQALENKKADLLRLSRKAADQLRAKDEELRQVAAERDALKRRAPV